MPPDPWPDDDEPGEVALAARMALYAACRLYPTGHPTTEQSQLAKFIMWSTDETEVGNRGFAEFLASAKEEIARELRAHARVTEALPDQAAALRRAAPVDVVGHMYAALRSQAAEAYGMAELLDLPLEVLVTGTGERAVLVTGAVPSLRSSVMLKLELALDLPAFARIPWVLTHELVCHAAARHTGGYGQHDHRATRQYFDEGFMSRTAATLLMRWRELETMACLGPAGHLSIVDVYAHHSRPEAIEAGTAAWTECRVAVGHDTQLGGEPGDAEMATINATLRLNTTEDDIKDKDLFVDFAKDGDVDKVTKFGRLVRREIEPEEVFAWP